MNENETTKPKPWMNIRITEEVMVYLRTMIAIADHEQHETAKKTLAGNISKSVFLKDKNNWFYEKVLKEMSEYMYLKNSWSDYFEINLAKTKSLPRFTLKAIWVNYQKQHEFNPPHNHDGLYSFVIFMKIPTHWKEQHALPFSMNSNMPCASDFHFLFEENEMVKYWNLPLSIEDEGRMLFFPARLQHQVFPFYECEEERITISGNIEILVDDMNAGNERTLEQKEKALSDMENQVKSLREMIQHEKNSEKSN